ncbi:MAG TPA: M20/M25/M40 family metallo-hydrolase [Bdellovibrionota bacterium]|nr:M20/M25/M40 family metallo-hydrolase [Bdellovibrionota bacterium]
MKQGLFRAGMHVLLFSLFIVNVPVNASELRLIETGPGQRAWMTEQEIDALATARHSGRSAGFMDVTDFADVSDDIPYFQLKNVFENKAPSQQRIVDELLPELSGQNFWESIEVLSAFHNRYYKSESGLAAANWIADQFTRLAEGRTDVTVELVQHGFPQPSVVATIQGRGPKANERIVLGGHSDSTSSGGGLPATRRAPGADDNASGIATLLEVFRVLAQSGFQPDRTIEFIAYAAEEVGLLGSQAIVRAHKTQNIPVIAVMQLDMTSYPGSNPRLTLISDYVNPDLNRFTEALIDTYLKVPRQQAPCGYGCSDHASWTRSGYPAVFPFEAPLGQDNAYIHSAYDTIDKLDMAFGMHFVKLGLAFAIETSLGEK